MKRLSLILVLLFLICTAFTKGSKGVIHGIISDETRKPLKGIGIKLKLGAHTMDYVYTNSKGHFTFENLDEGSYKVLVSGYSKGYESRFFRNVDVETDQLLEMNLSLTPMRVQEEVIVIHKNTTLLDGEEDWSDISNRNKK